MNYREEKNKLQNRIKELANYAHIDENISSNLQALEAEIEKDLQFNVLCTGEFNAGKSTFINRFFIKRDVLSTNVTEETAKLTFVRYGEKEKIVIHNLDKSLETINEVKEGILKPYVSKDGEKTKNVDFIEVFINSEVLKEGVTIVDSPGLNAPENERMDLTNKYVPEADAVLFLMSALQAWKGTEKEFLEEKILSKDDLDKIFFLINRWDNVLEDNDDGKSILDYVNTQMQKSLEIVKRDLGEVKTPSIIPISAKTKYNFEKLDQELLDYLSSKKGLDILNQKIKKFETIKQKILKLLNKKVELLNKDKEKLEEELKDIQVEIENLKKQAKQYKKSLRPKVENIIDHWMIQVKGLYEEFGHNITKAIQRKEIKNIEELDSIVKKIVINNTNRLQKQLNGVNTRLYQEIEDLADEEKAKFALDEFFIKRTSNSAYDLEKDLKAEIKKNKMDEFLPEVGTTIGVVSATVSFLVGVPSTSILIVGAPLLGGGIYMYYQRKKQAILENKDKIEEEVDIFTEEKIAELSAERDEIVEQVLDGIKTEIVQAFEEKEKEYKNIINKKESRNSEEIFKLQKKIDNI